MAGIATANGRSSLMWTETCFTGTVPAVASLFASSTNHGNFIRGWWISVRYHPWKSSLTGAYKYIICIAGKKWWASSSDSIPQATRIKVEPQRLWILVYYPSACRKAFFHNIAGACLYYWQGSKLLAWNSRTCWCGFVQMSWSPWQFSGWLQVGHWIQQIWYQIERFNKYEYINR